ELRRQVAEAAAAGSAFVGEPRDRIGALVVDNARMTVPHQPLHDVAAHAAKADHAELHALTSSQSRAGCFADGGEPCFDIVREVRAKHSAAAALKHAEVAAGLRRLDGSEA